MQSTNHIPPSHNIFHIALNVIERRIRQGDWLNTSLTKTDLDSARYELGKDLVSLFLMFICADLIFFFLTGIRVKTLFLLLYFVLMTLTPLIGVCMCCIACLWLMRMFDADESDIGYFLVKDALVWCVVCFIVFVWCLVTCVIVCSDYIIAYMKKDTPVLVQSSLSFNILLNMIYLDLVSLRCLFET